MCPLTGLSAESMVVEEVVGMIHLLGGEGGALL